MVVNYVANTMTFVYRSIMRQNIRHIMYKYNATYHELLFMPMSVIKKIWDINVKATYYDYTHMTCEMVVMRYCNNDAVLNKEECNAVISYLTTI